MSHRPSQRGTTLVEALIAGFIIGTSLMGIAALQVKAMQASTSAEHRAKATDIAWALADRMRANLLADTATGNDYVSGVISNCGTAPSSCAMAPDDASATGVTQCTPAQMAAFDLYEARCAANAGARQVLPRGTLAVTCNDRGIDAGDSCDSGSELLITVTWSTQDEVLDTGGSADFITMSVIPGADPFQ